jgi:hypothetical protein
MSFFSLFHGIPGVRRAIFRDVDGSVIEAMGGITSETESIASLAETIAHHTRHLGQLTKLGACELVVLRTDKLAKAMVLRRGAIAVLDLDVKRLSPDVEVKMRTTDWTAKAVDPPARRPIPDPTPTPKSQSLRKESTAGPTPIVKTARPDNLVEPPRTSSRFPVDTPALVETPAIPKMMTDANKELTPSAQVPKNADRPPIPDPIPFEKSQSLQKESTPVPTSIEEEPISEEFFELPTKNNKSPLDTPAPGEAAAVPELTADPRQELTPSARVLKKAIKLNITASAAAVGGDDSMFAGSLRMVHLPDLLEFCRNGRRTGMLFCHLGESVGSVRLCRGKILEAESPNTSKTTLLARLLASGDASEDQVKELDLPSDDATDDATIAQLLVDGGFTDPDSVRRAMQDQIKCAIKELIDWVDGTFAFHPMDEESEDPDSGMDPQVVLLHIFKEKDEEARDHESH